MQTLCPAFPLLVWCSRLHALQHSLDQTPMSATFQSSSEHGAPPFSSQSVTECILGLESILENLPTTFEVEKPRHRKVKKKKKNSHTFSQIRRKLGKMKFLWDWRDGSVLKSTCCFAEGSGWVPRALLVEHNGRSSSSKGSFHLFQPWWALHAGGTHTYMQKNARMT